MTTPVVPTDEELGIFARQQHDWFERVRKGSLDLDAVVRAVHRVIDPSFRFDKRQDGWKLLEDTQEPWPISANGLDLVPFLKEGESCVGGEEMVTRARGGELHANLGQRHAEYLLENQNDIPEEFRPYVLVFTGTVWRNRGICRRDVFCLYWGGVQWYKFFYWLGGDFGSRYRLLRSRE